MGPTGPCCTGPTGAPPDLTGNINFGKAGNTAISGSSSLDITIGTGTYYCLNQGTPASRITRIIPADGASEADTAGRYVILVNNCLNAIVLNNNAPTSNGDINFKIDTQGSVTTFRSSATLLYVYGYTSASNYTNCGRWIVVSIQ